MSCHCGILMSPCALVSVHCTGMAPSSYQKLPSRPTHNRAQASGTPVVTWPSATLGGRGQHQEEGRLSASFPAPPPPPRNSPKARAEELPHQEGAGASCPHPPGATCSPAERPALQVPHVPDAVFVSDGHTRRKGVKLDHGGDTRVPVQKYLVVQPCDTCQGKHTTMGLNLQQMSMMYFTKADTSP